MESAAEILKKSFANKFPKNTKTSSSDDFVGREQPNLGQSDCPHCDGMGYVIPDVPPAHPSFGRAVTCPCRAADQKAEQFNKLLKLSEIGELQESTFGNFAVKVTHLPGFTVIVEQSLRYGFEKAFAFAQKPEGWLVIKGGYGCGKTHLAAAIANYRLSLREPVLFISTPDLLDHLRATYRSDTAVSFETRFEQIRDASLLILDDLGTENSTQWAQEKLYQIFNYRYMAKLPTVFTTNQELEAIEPRIRSRMIDKQLSEIVRIIAPDFRRPDDYQDQSDLSTLSLHRNQTFGTFETRDRELPSRSVQHLKRVLETAIKYAQNPTNWIVFNSVAYGNGKTHLAAAIANYRADEGGEVLFVVVPDLLDYLREAFDPSSRVGLGRRFNEVKKTPLLILDDLGTESATAWAREKLYQLINYRYNARLPTVITSATPIPELDQRLATRMLDHRVCDFWVLEVPSYQGVPRAEGSKTTNVKDSKSKKNNRRKKPYNQ